MFLAFKEIVYSRGRYRMVVAVVFLITYMVFFLSSLSVGLARLNRLALDQWGAQSVVLSEYANKNFFVSIIKEEKFGPGWLRADRGADRRCGARVFDSKQAA